MNNLAKELKKKRDSEKRLEQNSPTPIFIGGEGGNNTYITNQQIINNFNEVNNEIVKIYNELKNFSPNIKQRDLLTNGDKANTELLFADGDVLWVEV